MLPESFFSPSSSAEASRSRGEDEAEGDATQPLLGAAALLSEYVGMAN